LNVDIPSRIEGKELADAFFPLCPERRVGYDFRAARLNLAPLGVRRRWLV
jgi:hypothetical protein